MPHNQIKKRLDIRTGDSFKTQIKLSITTIRIIKNIDKQENGSDRNIWNEHQYSWLCSIAEDDY